MHLRWSNFSKGGDAFHLSGYSFTKSSSHAPHTHDFAELFWVAEGDATEHLPGTERPMRKGTLSFVRPERIHHFSGSPRATLINIAMHARIPNEMIRRLGLGADAPWGKNDRTWFLTPSLLDEIGKMAFELSTVAKSRLVLERFLLNLLHLLGHEEEIHLQPAAPAWLRRACTEIQEPSCLAGGVHAFVKLAGRSAEHVSRATRKWTGRSPRQIVQKLQMGLAGRTLSLSDARIEDVAADCGYQNLGHFYKIFRRHHGCSPHRYRIAQLKVFGTEKASNKAA